MRLSSSCIVARECHQCRDGVTRQLSSSHDTSASSERRTSSILSYNSQRSATPATLPYMMVIKILLLQQHCQYVVPSSY